MKIWKLTFDIKASRITHTKKKDTWWINLNGFTKPCTKWPHCWWRFFFFLANLLGPLKNHEFIFLCLLTTLGLPDVMLPITPSNCNHFPPLKSNKKNSFWNTGDRAANTNLYTWKLFPNHIKNNIWTFHIFQQHTKMLSPQRKGNLLGTLIEVIIGQFLLAFGRKYGGSSGAIKAVKQLVHFPSHDINLFRAWKRFNHKIPLRMEGVELF